MATPPAPPPTTDWARLEPLGPQHNVSDHAAWMSSIDHIRSTPGFGPGEWGEDSWPFPMDLAANEADLRQHRVEFDAGEAFAYTVLDPRTRQVMGCVYVDPDPQADGGWMVRSWVTAERADLDGPLAVFVGAWLDNWDLPLRYVGR